MASKTTFPVKSEQTTQNRRTPKGGGNKESPLKSSGKESPAKSKREAKLKLSKALGDEARQARMHAELTQADVAERIGVATEVYGRLERGMLMPSVPTLRRLCVALRLQADVLLSLGTGRSNPAWTEPVPPPEKEGPQMRRLMRHVRKLTPAQLRALSIVAATLRRES